MNLIIIPAYNEERTIKEVILKSKNFGKVLVVDDGSKDKTAEIAKEYADYFIKNNKNLGKGGAIKNAQDFVKNLEVENIILIDADLQHNPQDISKIIECLNKYDVVLTFRNFRKMPIIKKIGNYVLTLLFKILYGKDVKDTQCGFRGMKKDIFSKINIRSRDYFIDTEILIEIFKYSKNYCQIEIETKYLDNKKGTTIKDGINIALKMIKYKFGDENE